MGNHMPYGITQCYQPPGSSDFPAFTPAKAGTRFSDPIGMQGYMIILTYVVVTSQDNLPAKDGHLYQI